MIPDATLAEWERDAMDGLPSGTKARVTILIKEIKQLQEESSRPKCLYCTFGEDALFSVDDIKQHIEKECDFHPLRKALAEIRRLRADLAEWEEHGKTCQSSKVAALEAEVKQLRADNQQHLDALLDVPGLKSRVQRAEVALETMWVQRNESLSALTAHQAVVQAADLYRDKFRLEDDAATDAARDGLFIALAAVQARREEAQ